MDLSTDIAIIGGGWAGFAAALEAQERGKRIVLIQKAPGATSLSSGALNLVDPLFPVPGEAWAEHRSLEKNLRELIRHRPFHPYALIQRILGGEALFPFLKTSVKKVLEALPMGWAGSLEHQRLHLTPFGTLKAAAAVQGSMADGDLFSMNQAKLLVVGIKGYAPFSSRFIKEALLEAQGSEKMPYLQFVGAFDLDLPGWEGRSSLSAFEIATRLDQEETFVKFGQSIFQYTQGKVYTHLLLPPVMGVINSEPIILALRKITGLKVAESLAVPLSIPGYRLDQAMKHSLATKGVERIEGEAVGYDAEHRMIKSVRVHSGTHRARVEAKAYVLATGKFIGGGVLRRRQFRESLFHLPLFEGDRRVEEKSLSDLTRPFARETQPLFQIGVRTNDRLQPLGEEWQPAFVNLFAAGSILGGFDAVHDRTGEGVAIATGASAGKNAGALL